VITLALRIAEITEVEEQVDESKLLTPASVAAVNAWLDREERPAAWLAEKADVSRAHLSFVLARKRECSPALAERVAAVIGVPLDLLLPPAHAAKAVTA
jgi:antitoxin component HigA of HigAB toxin-antitoxin module